MINLLVKVAFLKLIWELKQISQSVYDLSTFAHMPKILVNQGVAWSFLGLIVSQLRSLSLSWLGFDVVISVRYER